MVMGLREMERRLLDLERRTPIDGKDVVFERGPRGAVPICKRTCPRGGGGSGSGSASCAAKVTGKTGPDYNVDLYGDGLAKTKTGTATMQVVEIHINDVVPNGTKVIAHKANISITSGWGPS